LSVPGIFLGNSKKGLFLGGLDVLICWDEIPNRYPGPIILWLAVPAAGTGGGDLRPIGSAGAAHRGGRSPAGYRQLAGQSALAAAERQA